MSRKTQLADMAAAMDKEIAEAMAQEDAAIAAAALPGAAAPQASPAEPDPNVSDSAAAPLAEPLGDDPDPSAGDPMVGDPTTDDDRNQRKPSYWKALKAQEDRLKAEQTETHRKYQEEIGALRQAVESLRQAPPQYQPPPPATEEEDDETKIFRDAVNETLNPELKRLQERQFERELSLEMQIAEVKRADYFEVVPRDFWQQMRDPNPTNPLVRSLQQFPDVAARIGAAPNKALALYEHAQELRARDPSARDAERKAWEEGERARIRAEYDAEYKEKARALAIKDGRGAPQPSSIMSAPGTGAPAGGPFSLDSLKGLPREEQARILDDIIRRGSKGETIE